MGMKRKKRAPRRRGWLLGSSATQVICISFVLLIALGTLLLTLPISSRSGRLGVVDAMFTATSATCVTGLVVRDTWTQFTLFGQAVVLLLIQVGGLEVLYSDSAALHQRLQEANVPSVLECWPDMWHVFQMFPLRQSGEAMDKVAAFLRT